MKSSSSSVVGVVVGANMVLGLCLSSGCRTIHSREGDGGGTVQPSPQLLEAEPVHAQLKTAPTAAPEMRVERVHAAPVRPIVLTTPYTVQKGDTISHIAYRYSLRWQDVMAVNPGLNANRLRVGQTIKLPGQVDLKKVRQPKVKAAAPARAPVVAADGTTYTVQRGDSLSVIAKRFGVKTSELRAANNLSGDMIREGQKLRIPGAKGVSSTPAPTPAPAPLPVPLPTPAPVPAPIPTTNEISLPPPVDTSLTPAPITPPAVGTLAPPTPTTPTPPAAPAQTHTVKEGEDIYAVAIRWGVSPSELKALNNLTGPDLQPGTVLKIPLAP